jgi:uncharacterized protein (TIGR00251 family)
LESSSSSSVEFSGLATRRSNGRSGSEHGLNDSIRFTCRVIPRAKRTSWGARRAGLPTIRLAAPPVDGKANAALIRFLGAEFATAPSHVHIERGANGRTKTLRIDNARRIPAQVAVEPP